MTIDVWEGEERAGRPESATGDSGRNEEYRASMSSSERAAFDQALYGNGNSVADGAEYDWADAGCMGEAEHRGAADTERFADLQQEIASVWRAVPRDPRVAAANADWASCMADAGYSGLAAVGDGEGAVGDRMSAAADIETGAVSEDQMPELQEYERDVATVDIGCREEVGYATVERAVSRELQEAFVDVHRTELEAWVEAVGY
jgi:hypothetical protein